MSTRADLLGVGAVDATVGGGKVAALPRERRKNLPSRAVSQLAALTSPKGRLRAQREDNDTPHAALKSAPRRRS